MVFFIGLTKWKWFYERTEEGIINTHDPDEYQTVYFCAHGIQYQMSIGRTVKQTKLAVDIMELFVK